MTVSGIKRKILDGRSYMRPWLDPSTKIIIPQETLPIKCIVGEFLRLLYGKLLAKKIHFCSSSGILNTCLKIKKWELAIPAERRELLLPIDAYSHYFILPAIEQLIKQLEEDFSRMTIKKGETATILFHSPGFSNMALEAELLSHDGVIIMGQREYGKWIGGIPTDTIVLNIKTDYSIILGESV